ACVLMEGLAPLAGCRVSKVLLNFALIERGWKQNVDFAVPEKLGPRDGEYLQRVILDGDCARGCRAHLQNGVRPPDCQVAAITFDPVAEPLHFCDLEEWFWGRLRCPHLRKKGPGEH